MIVKKSLGKLEALIRSTKFLIRCMILSSIAGVINKDLFVEMHILQKSSDKIRSGFTAVIAETAGEI